VNVWQALADGTRREMLDRLAERPRTTGELATFFPMSRIAVMKHLAVLASAGLVIPRKVGRERWHYLNAVPLEQAYARWVSPLQRAWAAQLTRAAEAIEREPVEASMSPVEERTRDSETSAGVLRIEMEIPIAAPVETAWRALTSDAPAWWPKDFQVDALRAMRFEARLGGRLYEEATDGSGVVWYTVVGMERGRSLDLVGHLAVRYGGPALTLLRLALREDAGGCVLELGDAVLGRVSDATRGSLESGWRYLFETGFKAYVEAV
jgi:DNA-binding transcriptional ArsR family regulator